MELFQYIWSDRVQSFSVFKYKMKMRKEFGFIVGCILLASCNVSSNGDCVRGVVADATMNAVTVVANGNDTLYFATENADKSNLKGLLIGDSIEVLFIGKYEAGIDAVRLATIVKPVEDEYMRLFKYGVRMEAVEENLHPVYLLFGQDSLTVELISLVGGTKEVLERHGLPSKECVWNDENKILRLADNCWSISQQGKLLYKQSRSDNDEDLGMWEESHFVGVASVDDSRGIEYNLYLRNREYSGDGYFLLRLTCLGTEESKNAVRSYLGTRNTQRGTHADNDAVVWQLISDDRENIYNFIYNADRQNLMLLNENFELENNGLDCVLKKVEDL